MGRGRSQRRSADVASLTMIDWNEYELVLESSSEKECEVTGREMGGTEEHTCPVSKLLSDEQAHWSGDYGGYGAVRVTFLGADEEGLHLKIYHSYESLYTLKPGERWSSGWYSFGSWNYHVALYLRKKANNTNTSTI